MTSNAVTISCRLQKSIHIYDGPDALYSCTVHPDCKTALFGAEFHCGPCHAEGRRDECMLEFPFPITPTIKPVVSVCPCDRSGFIVYPLEEKTA